MMIAVLVDATLPGSSVWAAVRSAQKIKVEGLNGGELVISFDGDEKPWIVKEDIVYPLPKLATRVKVDLIRVGNGSRVSVDME
jgi:hypothetical protein